MAIELKQYLKLSQQLVITPQLQQAIKLIQLTHHELKQEIEAQLNENPCLEAKTTPDEESFSSEELKAIVKSALDSTERGSFSKGARTEESPGYEQFISKHESLTDYLLWQLQHSHFKPLQLAVAQCIIGNLDEEGYLKDSVPDIAEKCGVGEDEAEAILIIIQQFDPVGVASRDLRECLLNQLWSLGTKNKAIELAEKILDEHFSLFIKRNIHKLERSLKESREKILDACHLLSQLNPKPGLAFHENISQSDGITPDVMVTKTGDTFHVSLNNEGLPRLRVSRYYLSILEGKGDRKDLHYVQEKIKHAVWFIKSIEQRQQSITKVAQSLLKFQWAFFEKGPDHISPLVLRQVADATGLHESTVSRVTKGKYIQTPHGLFELKYFFNSKISTLEEDVGSQTVKLKMRNLIASEPQDQPFSDEQLRGKLADIGINIARRTISKYRELMRILPSNARKKRF